MTKTPAYTCRHSSSPNSSVQIAHPDNLEHAVASRRLPFLPSGRVLPGRGKRAGAPVKTEDDAVADITKEWFASPRVFSFSVPLSVSEACEISTCFLHVLLEQWRVEEERKMPVFRASSALRCPTPILMICSVSRMQHSSPATPLTVPSKARYEGKC